jgi:hypothetical protein
MIKLICLLKRKPGLSAAEFRRYYEDHHVPLALKFLRGLLLDYRRNYPQREISHLSEKAATGETGFSYDAITEMIVRDADALSEVYRVLARPEVKSVIAADEEAFLDRSAIRILVCDEQLSAE